MIRTSLTACVGLLLHLAWSATTPPGAQAEEPATPAVPAAPAEEEPALEGEAKKKHSEELSRYEKRYKSLKNRDELLQFLNEVEASGTRAARDWFMDYARVVKSAEYRVVAFDALVKIGTAKGLAFVCGRHGVRSSEFIVQTQAVEALGRAPDRRAVAALLDAIADSAVKMETRGAICITLGKTAPDDAKVQEVLYQQLEDRRDTVRAKAIEALGYIKDERSFALLLDKLQNEKNANVREGAAKGLKHAGRQEAIPALKAAVANEKAQPVRAAAIATLKALGATAD